MAWHLRLLKSKWIYCALCAAFAKMRERNHTDGKLQRLDTSNTRCTVSDWHRKLVSCHTAVYGLKSFKLSYKHIPFRLPLPLPLPLMRTVSYQTPTPYPEWSNAHSPHYIQVFCREKLMLTLTAYTCNKSFD